MTTLGISINLIENVFDFTLRVVNNLTGIVNNLKSGTDRGQNTFF